MSQDLLQFIQHRRKPLKTHENGTTRAADHWWNTAARDQRAANWRTQHQEALMVIEHNKSIVHFLLWHKLAKSLVARGALDGADPADQRTVIKKLGSLFAEIGPEGNDLLAFNEPIYDIMRVLFNHWTQRAGMKFLSVQTIEGEENYQKTVFENIPKNGHWGDKLIRNACSGGDYVCNVENMKSWADCRRDMKVFLEGWQEGVNANQRDTPPIAPTQKKQTDIGLCCMALRGLATNVPRRIPGALLDRLAVFESWLGPGQNNVSAELIHIQQVAWDRFLLERSVGRVRIPADPPGKGTDEVSQPEAHARVRKM